MKEEEQLADDSEVIQTKAALPVRKPYFEIGCDPGGAWHWVLWSPNGRQMATNAVTYHRMSDAKQAVQNVQNLIAENHPVKILLLQ